MATLKKTENWFSRPTIAKCRSKVLQNAPFGPSLSYHLSLRTFSSSSSSCTTTELSKLLTSCLTAVKNMLSNIVKRYMRDPVKTYFALLKIQVKF